MWKLALAFNLFILISVVRSVDENQPDSVLSQNGEPGWPYTKKETVALEKVVLIIFQIMSLRKPT